MSTSGVVRAGEGSERVISKVVEKLRNHSHLLLMAPAGVLLIGVFALPMAALAYVSLQESTPLKVYEPGLTFESYRRFATDPFFVRQLIRTFQMGGIATALAVVMGTPVAYKIWRSRGKQKTVLLALVLLPLFTNIVARVYAWLLVFGKEGPLNWGLMRLGAIDSSVLFNFTFPAVVVGITYVSLPFFILILYGTLERIDWRLVETARSLGANKLKSITEVVLPLSSRGFAGAIAVAFAWGAGAFAEPQTLGSPTLRTTAIESGDQILKFYDWPFGAALAFILLVATLLFVFFTFKLLVRYRGTGS